MVRAISWLDEYEDWQSALMLCDRKSLVETLANSNQPDGDVHVQRPLGFVDPRCTHPPRRKTVVAHQSSLDCFIHDPTPRRRRGPPPKSRPNRPYPIPLRTPSKPLTLAKYDRIVGDGQLPTLRGGRTVV